MLRTVDRTGGFVVDLDTHEVDTLVTLMRQHVEDGYPLLASTHIQYVEVTYYCQNLDCTLRQIIVGVVVQSRPNFLLHSAYAHYEAALWPEENRMSILKPYTGTNFSSAPPIKWEDLPIEPREVFEIALDELHENFVTSDEPHRLYMRWTSGSDGNWSVSLSLNWEMDAFLIDPMDGTFTRRRE